MKKTTTIKKSLDNTTTHETKVEFAQSWAIIQRTRFAHSNGSKWFDSFTFMGHQPQGATTIFWQGKGEATNLSHLFNYKLVLKGQQTQKEAKAFIHAWLKQSQEV